MSIVTVIYSPFPSDETPFSSTGDAFIDWIDATICEGYKLQPSDTHDKRGKKRPTTVSEAVDIAESCGYVVVVKP